MAIKLILLVVFFAVMVYVGMYSRKHATSVDGFVLGGRSVGPWLTAFAYGTSYFSAVVFVGYAGQFGGKSGIASTWIGLGNAVIGSLLAWVVLGRRTKVMTQHLKCKTMPDFFGERYGSDALKVTASVIVFIFLISYAAFCFCLQWTVPPVRYGVSHSVYGLCDRDGCVYRGLCDPGRLHGNSHQ